MIKSLAPYGLAQLCFTNCTLERWARARKELQRIEREFVKVDRLLIPSRNDWATAGMALSNIGHKYGFELIGRARLTNDALIAMSCVSRGLVVQTKNPGDFKLIAEFRSFEWEAV